MHTQGEYHVKIKAEIRAMFPQANSTKDFQKIPEVEQEVWNRLFFLKEPRKKQLCQSLDPGLSAFRTMRQKISIVSASQLVVLCYSAFSKLIQ